jgi:uncharacterized protein (DUF1697 family)
MRPLVAGCAGTTYSDEVSRMARSELLGSFETFVALLRGINVGGKHMLPMNDIVAMFRDAGCSDARACIQSGNIVFQARPSVAARIPALVEKAISDQYGFSARAVLRTATELEVVATNNPLLGADADVGTLHVAFLADRPSPALVAALDPHRSPPDEFVARGREIYLRCPNGIARTKLTNQYFDAKLSTTSTVRTWRTVLKLLSCTHLDRAPGSHSK